MSKKVGADGKVYAFEPGKTTYYNFLQSIQINNINNIKLEHLAIYDRDTEIEFYENIEGSLGSSIYSNNNNENSYLLRTVGLNSYFEGKETKIDILRVDAEGCECKIIGSAEKLITDSPDIKIFVEWQYSLLKQFETEESLISCLSKLENKGFIFLEMLSFNHKCSPLENILSVEEILTSEPLEVLAIRANTLTKFLEKKLSNNEIINCDSVKSKKLYYFSLVGGLTSKVKKLIDEGVVDNYKDNNGFSSLYVSSQFGHAETVRELLNYQLKQDIYDYAHFFSSQLIAATNGHAQVLKVFQDLKLPLDNTGSALYMSSQGGHLEAVKILLQVRPNINYIASNGMTPLYVVVVNRHYKVLELLLEERANTEILHVSSGASPFYLAVYLNDPVAAAWLLTYKANKDFVLGDKSALQLAIENNQQDIIKMINLGIDTFCLQQNLDQKFQEVCNKNLYFVEAKVMPSENQIVSINENNYRLLNKFLFNAILNGDVKVESALIDLGAEANSFHQYENNLVTGLHVVAERNDLPMVKMLVEKGANINARVESLDVLDGATPLLIAALNGRVEIVDYLLKQNADKEIALINHIDPHESHHTPLYAAVNNSKTECVKLLLAHNAKISSPDHLTSLNVAKALNYNEIYDLLIEKYTQDLELYFKNKNESTYLIEGFEVVVVRYKEDILWVFKEFPNAKITIYNKGENNLVLPSNAKEILIPNKGYLGGAFIYHIITNFNNLATKTLFLQGDVYDTPVKLPLFEEYILNNHTECKNIIAKCKGSNLKDETKTFLEADWKGGFLEGKFKNFTYKYNNLTEFGEKFISKNLPETFTWPAGSLFAVNKENLLCHPIELFTSIGEVLNSQDFPREDFFVEKFWDLITDCSLGVTNIVNETLNG